MIKKILVFADNFGLSIMAFLTAVLFLIAVQEQLVVVNPGQPFKLSMWISSLVDVTTDSGSTPTGWRRYYEFAFNMTIGWAAIRIYMTTAGLQLDEWTARWLLRDHIVIFGGGKESNIEVQSSMAIELASELSDNNTVVFYYPGLNETHRINLWNKGVTVLSDTRSIQDLLGYAGVERAKSMIAFRSDFTENIALCRTALSLYSANEQLECKCFIAPLRLKQKIKAEDYFEDSMLSKIRLFNDSEFTARGMINSFPPDTGRSQSDDRIHILIIGFGSVGQALTQNFARIGHYRSGKKPKITIIDRNAISLWQDLIKRIPAIVDLLIIETHEFNIEDIDSNQLERLSTDIPSISMVYVCTSNEMANLRISRLFLKIQNDLEVAIKASIVTLKKTDNYALTDFALSSPHRDRFHLYSVFDRTTVNSSHDLTFDWLMDMGDGLAKLFHEAYCRNDDLLVHSNPQLSQASFNMAWDKLPEGVRNANRVICDHFEVKIRALNLKLIKTSEGEEITLNSQELEILSKMEHNRWWADRALDGWRLGERDNKAKFHPNMVPYEELSEPVKQLDRDSVLSIIELIKNSGYIISK